MKLILEYRAKCNYVINIEIIREKSNYENILASKSKVSILKNQKAEIKTPCGRICCEERNG
jgi:hypothetical protein